MLQAGMSEEVNERRRPVASSPLVARTMRRMGRADTAPELALRRELTRAGLRYRLHRRDLPGRPDISLGPARVAIFVDGCFWHACPEHCVMPKANREFWAEKLAANRARDKSKDDALIEMGWLPLHVWEHEDPSAAASVITRVVADRRAG
jgi:DNA mismatch endonuclease, patch repair protein